MLLLLLLPLLLLPLLLLPLLLLLHPSDCQAHLRYHHRCLPPSMCCIFYQ
jgi:hypothetical protein